MKTKLKKYVFVHLNNRYMTKLELDITNKIFRIECSNCSKTFVMTFDELEKLGVVKCQHCGHEHFLMKINN